MPTDRMSKLCRGKVGFCFVSMKNAMTVLQVFGNGRLAA